MLDADQEFQERLELAKLEAMKELAYGASHEINNPLANISARAQTLLRDEPHPERRRALEAIHHQALRAHEMISDLMLFARPPKLEVAAVDLTALIAGLAAEVAAECDRREIDLAVIADSPLPAIEGDAIQLSVAIKAVVTNAIEAVGRDGKIEVETTASTERPMSVNIEIRDTGPGIPAQIRSHIFDPFFSGREAGRGLGFGLSKAWRIVTEHGGRIAVGSGDGPGAKFVIDLPLAPPSR